MHTPFARERAPGQFETRIGDLSGGGEMRALGRVEVSLRRSRQHVQVHLAVVADANDAYNPGNHGLRGYRTQVFNYVAA
jgi:hypothetical protein